MRTAYTFVGALAVVALAIGLMGNRAAIGDVLAEAPATDQQPALEPVPADSMDYSYGTDGSWQGGYRGCRSRENFYSRMLSKWAEVGYFNCSCRGSYKFPVPPQYTYHWPGMYSQRTMTEYNSPYRFPPLKAPPVADSKPEPYREVRPDRPLQVEIEQAARLTPVSPTHIPSKLPDFEPVSKKIRRHYGLN